MNMSVLYVRCQSSNQNTADRSGGMLHGLTPIVPIAAADPVKIMINRLTREWNVTDVVYQDAIGQLSKYCNCDMKLDIVI